MEMTWSKLVKKSCGLIVLSILTVFGDASEATVEILPAATSSLSGDGQDSSPHLNALSDDDHEGGQSIQPDKRAYTYVSEFKRLPLYNFGVGKRFDSDMEDDKRSQKYDFGVGKRTRDYNFGMGKRTRDYNFGMGKRSRDYNFGMGKRTRDYNFGMGKRTKGYNFGLGKRYNDLESALEGSRLQTPTYYFNSNNMLRRLLQKQLLENYWHPKRTSSGFNFGIGKRDAEMDGDFQDDDFTTAEREQFLLSLADKLADYDDEDDLSTDE